MHFAGGTEAVAKSQAGYCADAIDVRGSAEKMNAQTGLAGNVLEEFCRRTVLSHGQVGPAIVVEVADRRAALLAIHAQAGILARHCLEFPPPHSAQEQASPSIEARQFGRGVEKVLA